MHASGRSGGGCALHLLPLILLALPQTGRAELRAVVYGNTAHAGPPVSNSTVASLADVPALLRPWHSAVVQGRVTAQEWALFSVDTDAGFVRLRVDDHLLVDGGPAAPVAPTCAFPGGDPSALPGYDQWQDTWMPVNGSDDPRSMSGLGGDCKTGCSERVCQALCEKLAPQGCVGFYTHKHQWNFCSMRKLGSPSDTWQVGMHCPKLAGVSRGTRNAAWPGQQACGLRGMHAALHHTGSLSGPQMRLPAAACTSNCPCTVRYCETNDRALGMPAGRTRCGRRPRPTRPTRGRRHAAAAPTASARRVRRRHRPA